MKKEESSRKIYDKATGEWFSVAEDDYAAYDHWRTNLRKREQRHGNCYCPRDKWWLCDGMCDDCEFRCAGDAISLDTPEGEDDLGLGDQLVAFGPRMEDVIADRDLIEKLVQLLREMDPDADKIIEMWQENWRISDRQVAERLGRAQKTFSRQMRKYRDACRKYIYE